MTEGNPMGFSPEALAELQRVSEAQAARMAGYRAEREAEAEARLARWKADYEAMTPEEQAAHDEAMKPQPPVEVRVPADVTDEMTEAAAALAVEDDQGRIDWERTIDRLDGTRSDDGATWDFGDLGYDDPVFEKIKRGVRQIRRGDE